MAPPTTTPDSVVKELVAQRDGEIRALQTRRAEELKEREAKGQERVKALMQVLNPQIADQLKKLNEVHAAQAKEAQAHIKKLKAKLEAGPSAVVGSPEAAKALMAEAEAAEAPLHEQLPNFMAFSPVMILHPYYARLYGSDGSVYWSGYSPGNVTLWDSASGAGAGWFGTGAGEFTVYADWWFYFYAASSRWYSYWASVPYHGYYIAYADDGFWTSKEAKVSLNLALIGYQYGYKTQSTVNLFYYDGQNINIWNRYDNTPSMYYADLLGGPDYAYLRLTTSLYVYARRDGSHAEINFAAGTANYIGVPWISVF